MFWSGFPDNLMVLLNQALDFGLIFFSVYFISFLIQERRAQRMTRGLLFLFGLLFISDKVFHLTLFSFVLERFILICVLSLAIVFQSDVRRFLELLGQGEFEHFFQSSNYLPKEDIVIDEIVDAVKELSQNRIGALIVIETFNTIEERIFLNPGVRLNATISKELLQSIFQTKSLLHDGAVFIRGSEIVSAAVILPLSERSNSKKMGKLGTRHRAAMGLCEKVENCICIVVSEETGSISLGEKGVLNRPLTSTKLKDLLEEKLSNPQARERVTGVSKLSKTIGFHNLKSLFKFFQSNPQKSSPNKKR
jgi:uncharacterized protein (TIGR00159 family)